MSKNVKELEDDIKRKAMAWHRWSVTPDGKKCLDDLADNFKRDKLLGDTDAQTNYNVGQHDVIAYVEQMIRIGNSNE